MMESKFNTYKTDLRNSFDSLLEPFDKTQPVYYRCTFVNEHYAEGLQECLPLFSTANGFFLQNDQIIANVNNKDFRKDIHIAKLILIGWNRFYYTYKDDTNNYYYFYTKLGFEKIFQFWNENPGQYESDEKKDYIGAISIYKKHSYSDTKSFVTVFLRTTPTPKSRAWNCLSDNDVFAYSVPDIKYVSKNIFLRALLFDLLKYSHYDVSEECNLADFDWNTWYSEKKENFGSKKFFQLHHKLNQSLYYLDHDKNVSEEFICHIRRNYGIFSDEQKDMFALLWPKEYKYTTDESGRIFHAYAMAKMQSLYNSINKRYLGIAGAYGMSTNPTWQNKDFIKEMENAANALINEIRLFGRCKSEDKTMLSVSLLFINLMYHAQVEPNKYGVKEIAAILIFYNLYKELDNNYSDKNIIRLFLIITLISNKSIFTKALQGVKKDSTSIQLGNSMTSWSWQYENLEYCFNEIVFEISQFCHFDLENLLSEESSIFGTSLLTKTRNNISAITDNLQLDGNHTFMGTDSLRKFYLNRIYQKIDAYLSDKTSKFGDIF